MMDIPMMCTSTLSRFMKIIVTRLHQALPYPFRSSHLSYSQLRSIGKEACSSNLWMDFFFK